MICQRFGVWITVQFTDVCTVHHFSNVHLVSSSVIVCYGKHISMNMLGMIVRLHKLVGCIASDSKEYKTQKKYIRKNNNKHQPQYEQLANGVWNFEDYENL